MDQPRPIRRVFVSSTYLDLLEERQSVEDVLQRIDDTKFVGMEYFGSSDATPLDVCLRHVATSQLYIGILGKRYGSGYTEAEYDHAVSRAIPCRIYATRSSDTSEESKQRALFAKIKARHHISYFDSPAALAVSVAADLANLAGRPTATVAGLPFVAALAVPSAEPLFVGRSRELASVVASISTGDSVATAVRGMAGIGKTQLAVVAAHQLRRAFPDGVAFLQVGTHSDNPLSLADAALALLSRLGVDTTQLSSKATDVLLAYQHVISSKKLLVVLDDVRSGFATLVPSAGQSRIIATSREALGWPRSADIKLDAIRLNDAKRLLLHYCPRAEPAAIDIARSCGCVPLALKCAGRLLAVYEDLNPVVYSQRLADERQRLAELSPTDLDDSVGASVRLSVTRLTQVQRHALAALTVFAEAFSAPVAAQVIEDRDGRHLSFLVRMGLVDYRPEQQLYRLHDLIKLFVRTEFPGHPTFETRLRHAEAFSEGLEYMHRLSLRGSSQLQDALAMFDVAAADIVAAQMWCAANMSANRTACRIAMVLPWAGSELLSIRQPEETATEWLRVALQAAYKLGDGIAQARLIAGLGQNAAHRGFGSERLRLLRLARTTSIIAGHIDPPVLTNLGLAEIDEGALERGVFFLNSRLQLARARGDRRGEAYALGALGSAHVKTGAYGQARGAYKESSSIARAVGADAAALAADLGLARVLRLEGSLDEAITVLASLLQRCRDLGDWKHFLEAALEHAAVGEVRDDVRMSQDVLDEALIVVRTFGGEEDNLRILSEHLRIVARSQPQQAISLAQDIIKRATKLQQPLHLLLPLLLLGDHASDNGDHGLAKKYFRQAVEICEVAPLRPKRLSLLRGLARAEWHTGERNSAEAHFEEALAGARQSNDSRYEGSLLWAWAELIHDSAAAYCVFERAILDMPTVEPDAGYGRRRILHHALGEFAYMREGPVPARAYLERWDLVRAERKIDASETEALFKLGRSRYEVGLLKSAHAVFLQTYTLDVAANDSKGLIASLIELNNCEVGLGRVDLGMRRCQAAIAVAQKSGNRKGEATARRCLAQCLWLLGRRDSAIDQLETALRDDDTAPAERAEWAARLRGWKARRESSNGN